MHDFCLNAGTDSSLRKGLLFAFLLVSACLLILAIAFLVKDHQKTQALAIMAMIGLLAVMMVGIWTPGLLHLLARPVCRGVGLGLPLAGLAWGFLSIGIAYTHAVNGWDEGAYLLSGLALRGYATPYAAHRAPVTHVLAAMFADVPWLINPVLLLGLVTLLTIWGARRWGWSVAVIPLLLLIGQNVFLNAVLNVMAELPTALLLLAAFFLFNWLRVLDTAEGSQVDQRVCQQLHAIMPLLDAFKSEQQPFEFIFPRKGALDSHA